MKWGYTMEIDYQTNGVFAYFDIDDGVWCGALCRYTLAGLSTIIEHTGSVTVAETLRRNPPKEIMINGERRRVDGFVSRNKNGNVQIAVQQQPSDLCYLKGGDPQ